MLGKNYVVRTLTAVGRFFQRSEKTMGQWRSQGMPQREDGLYDLREILRWWKAEKLPRIQHSQPKADPAGLEKQKLEIEVAHKRLKFQVEKGELVRRDLVHATMLNMFHRLRARLQAMPEEMSASLPPADRAVLIARQHDSIRAVLREIAGWADDSEQ